MIHEHPQPSTTFHFEGEKTNTMSPSFHELNYSKTTTNLSSLPIKKKNYQKDMCDFTALDDTVLLLETFSPLYEPSIPADFLFTLP